MNGSVKEQGQRYTAVNCEYIRGGKKHMKKKKRYLTDEVAVLKVEPIQLVTSLLCAHDIIVDNKSSAFFIRRSSQPDLSVLQC